MERYIKWGGDILESSKDKPARRGGPDLLGKMRRAPADNSRILAKLEHGGAAPPLAARYPIIGRNAILAAGSIFLLGIFGWMSYEQTTSPSTQLALPSGAPARPPTASATPAIPAAQARAATIINETASTHVQTPRLATEIAAAAALQASPVSHPPALARAPGAPPVHDRIPQAARKPAPPAVHAGPASDSDVTLLAALVAHAKRQAPVDGQPNRDVVMRQEMDSTASLLQRCQQLGLIEGMLCRSRICAGRWDSDPVCR